MKIFRCVYRLFLLLMLTILFLIGCSQNIGDDPPVMDEINEESHEPRLIDEAYDSDEVEKDGDEKFESSDSSDGMPASDATSELVTISREEAGLTTCVPFDFGELELNQQIRRLLEHPEDYSNTDYQDGLIQTNGVLVTERFQGEIIDHMMIGSPIDHVIDVLGQPTVRTSKQILYKSKQFDLGFQGDEKIEQAVIQIRPTQTYDQDILKHVLERLQHDGIYGLLAEDMSDWFGWLEHIHGGGWYAESGIGIEVVDFDGLHVTVYNIFEGDLYQYDPVVVRDDFSLTYVDGDPWINDLMTILSGYERTNQRFREDGIRSPSGQKSMIYEWVHSELQYFTIRHLDHSRPDLEIGAIAKQYEWLDDDHILYMDAWQSIPYIIQLESMDHINIFYEVGLLEPGDIHGDEQPIELLEVSDQRIVLRNTDEEITYDIAFSIDPDGTLRFHSLHQTDQLL